MKGRGKKNNKKERCTGRTKEKWFTCFRNVRLCSNSCFSLMLCMCKFKFDFFRFFLNLVDLEISAIELQDTLRNSPLHDLSS